MIMAESAVVAQMRTLISSSDPGGAYVELSIVDVPGLGSRPAHQVIKAKCTFCDASKTGARGRAFADISPVTLAWR